MPTTTGQCESRLSHLPPKAAISAPSRGNRGTSGARLVTTALPGLARMRRLDAGGGGLRVGLGAGLGLGRLGLVGGVLNPGRARLAEVVPEAHVERRSPLEEDQHQ